MVTVVLVPEAQKQLDDLPRGIVPRIWALIARLYSWPAVSGAKPLTANLVNHYRMRTGDYGVQFSVETSRSTYAVTKTVKGKRKSETVVTLDYVIRVGKIGHRAGFYEA